MHFKETKHTKCKLTNSASTDIGQPTYLLMEKLWQFIVLKCKTVYKMAAQRKLVNITVSRVELCFYKKVIY